MNITTTTTTTCDPLSSFQCLITTGYQQQQRDSMSFLADLPPPRRNDNFHTLQQQQDHYKYVDSLLEQHWSENDGFFVTRKNRALTYGEVTPLGARHLAAEMNLSGSFVDLGSGVGRLVTQMYLDNNVKKAIGVELSQRRHEIGERALADLLMGQDTIPTDAIQLIHGDAIAYLDNLLLSDTEENITHVYMSSLCFPKDVLAQLEERLLKFPTHLHVVAALNRLDAFASHQHWRERRHVPIQMSWGPSTVHVYERIEDESTESEEEERV